MWGVLSVFGEIMGDLFVMNGWGEGFCDVLILKGLDF